MLRSYLPAIVFLVLGGAVGGAFAVLNSVIGPRRAIPHKQDPYECGLPSEVKRGLRFGISFYLIAMLFILFDIEVVFLYPIAVELRAYGGYRAGGDDHLHRAASRGLRLRLAARSVGVEITREPIDPAGGGPHIDGDALARRLNSRQLLRAPRLKAPTPRRTWRERTLKAT